MKLLFMGTPDFALFSLKALMQAGEDVIGVVTQPDKPRGRGYELTPPPVKRFAQTAGLPVWQPGTLRGEAFASLLDTLAPELIVVVAYGKILPGNVLTYPRYGCINVHGSLLPAYRGAAPMQRAILDGCTVTGVTTMYMDEGMDTGDMLLKAEVPIGENDTFEDIHDRLGTVGADLLVRTLQELRAGTLVRTPQDGSLATYAAKIEKQDCLLDFTRPARELHNQIRGLSPLPLAVTATPDGRRLKIIASHLPGLPAPVGIRPGTVLALNDGCITVACGQGALALDSVVPEGKSRMSAADFIRGRKIAVGDLLGATLA